MSLSSTAGKIVDAAEALVAQFGFNKITVEDIAREAGVGRATVYLHFKSKKEIGLAYTDRVHHRLLEYLGGIVGSSSASDEKLRRMLVGRVMFAFDAAPKPPAYFDEMFAAIKPLYMIRREEYFENEAQLFMAVLREGIGSPGPHSDHERLTAVSLILATNGLMPFNLNHRQLASRSEVEARAARIAQLLVSGLLHKITTR